MGQAVEDPRAIRTAPQGMVRLVHEDARDHWPTVEGDFPDLSAVQSRVAADWAPHAHELAVYDDTGARLSLS